MLNTLSLHNKTLVIRFRPNILTFLGLSKLCTYIIWRGKNSVRQIVIRKVTFLLNFNERHFEVTVVL